MSIVNDDNSLNITAKSCFDDSLNPLDLNNDLEFSNLDLSEIPENESTIQGTSAIKANDLTGRCVMSISMEAAEIQKLAAFKQQAQQQETADSLILDAEETLAEHNNNNINNNTNVSSLPLDETMNDSVDVEKEDCSVMHLDEEDSINEESIAEESVAVCQNDTKVEDTFNISTNADADIQTNERNYFQSSLIELGRRLWKSTPLSQHYTKGCIWSPDGTCILVPVHLDGMHVIELPTDIYTLDTVSSFRAVNDLKSAVHVKEGGTVYDCAWYPFMNSGTPETCCWIATRQHEPIHMWDAFDGELRCTYRGYDDVDEVESAISVTFSNDGQQVIGGYKKSIKVFDTNVPGRDCNAISVKQAVSCFALTPDNDDTVTAGSWNGYINHYDLRVPKLGSLFTLGGHTGGITWLQYAQLSGQSYYSLFSGARKDNKILQWDMRNYTKPVRELRRAVTTNQRIYFDLSMQREWLISGDTTGILRAWDLCGELEDIELPLHDDCCNGVSFHPSRPVMASSSGQYHFADVTQEEVLQEETDLSEKIVDYENALLLLWFGKSDEIV